jgi:hypothetical protein
MKRPLNCRKAESFTTTTKPTPNGALGQKNEPRSRGEPRPGLTSEKERIVVVSLLKGLSRHRLLVVKPSHAASKSNCKRSDNGQG